MPSEIIVALLSLLGTAVGSITGIIASAQLTKYRLSQLEKKVEAHNRVVERMTVAENNIKHIYYEIDEMKGAKND